MPRCSLARKPLRLFMLNFPGDVSEYRADDGNALERLVTSNTLAKGTRYI